MARPTPSPGGLSAGAFACLPLGYLLLVLLGGLAFMAAEWPAEAELRAEAGELWRAFLRENPCVPEGRLRGLLAAALAAHRGDVAVLEADAGDGRYGFTSSLYFVVATLTTMGSDSYTPKSDEAKLFCVFYCTLGIPLTLFLLTLLSNRLLPLVTHAPLRHLRSSWGLAPPRAAAVHAALLAALAATLLFLLPALLVRAAEPRRSYLDALFFCLVTLTTVGEGGGSLGRDWGPGARRTLQLLTTGYLLLGLVVVLTLKDTLLQVPQVRALLRLLSGPRCTDLEGHLLDELTPGREEPRYSQSVRTISCSPLERRGSGKATAEP